MPSLRWDGEGLGPDVITFLPSPQVSQFIPISSLPSLDTEVSFWVMLKAWGSGSPFSAQPVLGFGQYLR